MENPIRPLRKKLRKALERLDARRRGCIEARQIAAKKAKSLSIASIEKAYRMPGSMKK